MGITEENKRNLIGLWLMQPDLTPEATKKHFPHLGISPNVITNQELNELYNTFLKKSRGTSFTRRESPLGSNPFMEDIDNEPDSF